MRILSFITRPRVINKILEHLKNRTTQTRGPPTHKLQQAPLIVLEFPSIRRWSESEK